MASNRIFNHVFQRTYLMPASISTHLHFTHCFKPALCAKQGTPYSTKKSVAKVDYDDSAKQVQVGLAEVVKENTKSVGYLGVIVGGIGVLGLVFYTIFRELFSGKSSTGVYSRALDRCLKHPKVVDALGEPIKAYGEENRRGRRRHVSHMVFMKNNKKHMRMQFYVQGIRRSGKVLVEVEENASGDYEYVYLIVKVDDILKSIIVIEDNQDSGLKLNTYHNEQLLNFQ